MCSSRAQASECMEHRREFKWVATSRRAGHALASHKHNAVFDIRHPAACTENIKVLLSLQPAALACIGTRVRPSMLAFVCLRVLSSAPACVRLPATQCGRAFRGGWGSGWACRRLQAGGRARRLLRRQEDPSLASHPWLAAAAQGRAETDAKGL